MDDRTFDEQTARDWISIIEKPGKSSRDEHVYPRLNELLRLAVPENILEIGCGQGICSDKIDLKACAYTGIDPSSHLIDRARQIYPQPERRFIPGNAYALPISDQSFEAAFSVMVWHLLGDLEKAASELSRVLTESGNFLIVTANPEAYPAWIAFYPDAEITGKKLEGTMRIGEATSSRDVLYLHTLDELRNSFQKFGLAIEKVETFSSAKDSPEMKLLISLAGRKSP